MCKVAGVQTMRSLRQVSRKFSTDREFPIRRSGYVGVCAGWFGGAVSGGPAYSETHVTFQLALTSFPSSPRNAPGWLSLTSATTRAGAAGDDH